ncbi:MAG: GNAT family N-acetyltransferase [Bacteroidota bacterium]
MKIRRAEISDRDEWARMRNTLWPGSLVEHIKEIDEFFSNKSKIIKEVFVLDTGNNMLGGFLELNTRNMIEINDTDIVPFVEGWFVDEALRRKGYGKQLMAAAEKWSCKNGYDKLISDTEFNNINGISAHKALGFEEVGRTVLFIKKLNKPVV